VHPLPKFVVLTSSHSNSFGQLLLHPLLQHPDPTQFGSQLPSARFASAPSRCSPAPPEIEPIVDSFSRLASDPSRYTNHFPMVCWCSCAFLLPAFDGRSPGTPELRHGRRTHSSTAKFHSYSPEHIPSRVFLGFCRPCLARSPSPECSPPARTPTGPTGRPSPWPGKALFANSSFVPGVPVQNYRRPPQVPIISCDVCAVL
jgi:hypothetical protein